MQAIDLIDLAAETPAMQEARRAVEVCNACRYCEGYCAVFPAMELRREFAAGDLNYLVNLCHACKGCYYACQYAPPHEFGINVPRVLAEVRAESYAQYAWPGLLAGLYRRNGLVMALALGVGGVLLLAMGLQHHAVLFGPQPVVPGQGFYNVVPYGVMVGVASATFLFSLLALAVGFARFWRDTGGRPGELLQGRPLLQVLQVLRDAATLRYLGGGHGCNDQDGSFSTRRRMFHHLMAYDFLLCFASTSTATVYDHLLGWPVPYGFWSLPVLLGVVGGAGLIAGTAGLFWTKLAADQEPEARRLLGADAGLLLLLLMIGVTGVTGELLLAVRATGAIGVALAAHLGFVLAFFVTMPYSKFVPGLYRTEALIRYAIERPGANDPKPHVAVSATPVC